MYSKLKLFELEHTKFQTMYLFFTELSKVFRGGEI